MPLPAEGRRQDISADPNSSISLIDFRFAFLRSLLLLVLLSVATGGLTYGLRMHVLSKADAVQVKAAQTTESQQLELLLYEPHTVETLGAKLKASGLELKEQELRWAASILNIGRFRPGRYLINGQVSYPELLGRLLRGEEDPKNIIIHPGQTYERFYERVGRQFRFEPEELAAVMTDTTYITEELNLAPQHFFGRMLPNTYQMYWTNSPRQVVERLLSEFERAIQPYEAEISAHRFDLNEILTMAAIVELEAVYNDEMPRIAGLYLNRLNRRMRLQADPTVSYALAQRGRLTTASYRTEHPYNTYRINGLPPGPITNPSLSAIRAVIQPEEHNYLFMVATPEGRHAFTRTYAQHRQEVRRWRQWLREQDRLRRTLERAEGES